MLGPALNDTQASVISVCVCVCVCVILLHVRP